MKTPTFTALDRVLLIEVAGGAARVTPAASAGSTEILRTLEQVTDSIKDLARNNANQTDPSMMMMMMMMMGGLGGGGGGGAPAAAAAPPPPRAPLVSIQNHVSR